MNNVEIKIELIERVERWLKDTSDELNISGLYLKKWPDALAGKEDLIVNLNCSWNRLTVLPLLPKLTELFCSGNGLTSLQLFPERLPKLTKLCCYENRLTSLPVFPNLTELDCSANALVHFPLLPKLTSLTCYHNRLMSLPLFSKLTNLFCPGNNLFSNKLTGWKKVWRLKKVRNNEIRARGLKKVVKVLKNRLYLPRLDDLKQELIYSPNHPGKFYKGLRAGNWNFKNQKSKTNE